MKAARIHELEPDLEGDDLVRLDDIAEPELREPTDVIVRVGAAGVCRTDLHLIAGEEVGGSPLSLPHVPGHENAGWVAEIGPAVRTVEVGDPVVCYPFSGSGLSLAERAGLDSRAPERRTPGINAPGGFAGLTLVSERSIVRLAQDADPSLYAPLTDAGLAAYRAAHQAQQHVRAGDTVVVLGVGGLGHLAVQLVAELTSATIVASDPRAAARDLAQECGADVVVGAGEELAEALENVTRGEGVEAVIDLVGSDETISVGLSSLRLGGTYYAVGIGGSVDLPAAELIEGEKRLVGCFVGTYVELVELVALLDHGRLHPKVQRYPLSAVNTALTDLRDGRVAGRAVLIPDDSPG